VKVTSDVPFLSRTPCMSPQTYPGPSNPSGAAATRHQREVSFLRFFFNKCCVRSACSLSLIFDPCLPPLAAPETVDIVSPLFTPARQNVSSRNLGRDGYHPRTEVFFFSPFSARRSSFAQARSPRTAKKNLDYLSLLVIFT